MAIRVLVAIGTAPCAAVGMIAIHTANFAYNDTQRGIRKVFLFAKCPCTQRLIIHITVRWDFALGMEILSLFANCVISAVIISKLSLYPQLLLANCRYMHSCY